MTDRQEEPGDVIAVFRPWTLGVNAAAVPVSANWPFAKLSVFQHGINARLLGRDVWVDHDEVLVVARSAGGIRIEWDGGVRTNAIFLMGLRRGRLVQALESAGFAVR